MAISMLEIADRLAIRALIDAYAHCADRRDAKGQMALFAEDVEFLPQIAALQKAKQLPNIEPIIFHYMMISLTATLQRRAADHANARRSRGDVPVRQGCRRRWIAAYYLSSNLHQSP
jgi:hypothetical protein